MKRAIEFVSILTALFIIILGLSSCQLTDKGPSKDIEEDIWDNQERIKENDQVIGGNSQGGNENTKGDSINDNKNSFEKLNINSKVVLEENYDYISINEPSIDFEIEDLGGNTVKLSDYRGQIVFLNFWATWCPPCRAEMPDMEAIHREYGQKGVAILGVNSTEIELRSGRDSEKAKEQVKSFIQSQEFTFTIPLDSDNELLAEYGNIYPILGIPTTFIIDREGIIRYIRWQAFQSKEQIEAFIALLD